METNLPNSASAGHGLAQLFGLDIRAAALTIIIDLMANSASIVSAGLLYPVEILAAIALMVIVFKIQVKWFGDSFDSALIKSLIVGALTAIPVATTPFILAYAVGGSLVGLRRQKTAAVAMVEAEEVWPK